MKKNVLLLTFLSLIWASCNQSTPSRDTDNSKEEKKEVQNSETEVKEKVRSGMDSLNAILIKDPNDAATLVERANFLIERNQFQRAANDIARSIEIDPSIARAHQLKGDILFAQNKSREARQEWQLCIELDPDNVPCRHKLAELHIAVKDYDKALEYIDEAMSIDNKNAVTYFIKGLIVRDAHQDTSLALNYFQKAVDLKQDFVEALDMMGVTLANRRDSMARFYYERILELEPNNADVYYKLGLYYMLRDDINKALENYTKAVQLNPQDAESYFNLGFMHIELRQFAQARDYFTKAIQVKEQNFKAYYGRGYAFEMLGDVINARKDYLAAIKANPVYVPAKEALDRVNATMKR